MTEFRFIHELVLVDRLELIMYDSIVTTTTRSQGREAETFPGKAKDVSIRRGKVRLKSSDVLDLTQYHIFGRKALISHWRAGGSYVCRFSRHGTVLILPDTVPFSERCISSRSLKVS